jgi:hypothetical protein
MANPIVSETFIKLLTADLRAVEEDKFQAFEKTLEKIFGKLPSDSAWEEFFEVGGLGDIPRFNGKITTLGISPGYSTRIEPAEFAAQVQFERKFLDDKKYDVIVDTAGKLKASAIRTREKTAVEPWTGAFSAIFNYGSSEEGLSWANSSHTTKTGVSTTTGFANAGSSALDKTSIAATYLLMRRFKDMDGERIGINPDMLVVPDALRDKAEEIVKTSTGLYSAEGTVNVNKGRYEIMPIMRWDDTSTKNWAMVDSSLMKKCLKWVDRISPETYVNFDQKTFMTEYAVYMRYGWMQTEWRWGFCHNVS